MARYRKIETRLWVDAKFRGLSERGRMLWLYLLTGTRTLSIPGVIHGRPAVLADDLRWSEATFQEAFQEAFAKGLVEADWDAGLVVLPKALLDGRGQPRQSSRPESPNVLKGWAKAWPEVPECHLKVVLWQRLRTFAEGLGEAFAKAFEEAFEEPSLHPFANQEQEQEQEQEIFSDASAPEVPALKLEPQQPKAKPKKRGGKKREPMPFTVAQLVDAFERGARDRFVYDGAAVNECAPALTDAIRRLASAGKTLADVEAAGQWVYAKFRDPVGPKWLATRGALADAMVKADNEGMTMPRVPRVESDPDRVPFIDPDYDFWSERGL